MATVIKFCPAIKELRIHLCPKGDSSKGVRDFLEKYYVPLKKKNAKFPILIRECSGIQPRVWARYGYGREDSCDVSKIGAEEIMKIITNFNNAK